MKQSRDRSPIKLSKGSPVCVKTVLQKNHEVLQSMGLGLKVLDIDFADPQTVRLNSPMGALPAPANDMELLTDRLKDAQRLREEQSLGRQHFATRLRVAATHSWRVEDFDDGLQQCEVPAHHTPLRPGLLVKPTEPSPLPPHPLHRSPDGTPRNLAPKPPMAKDKGSVSPTRRRIRPDGTSCNLAPKPPIDRPKDKGAGSPTSRKVSPPGHLVSAVGMSHAAGMSPMPMLHHSYSGSKASFSPMPRLYSRPSSAHSSGSGWSRPTSAYSSGNTTPHRSPEKKGVPIQPQSEGSTPLRQGSCAVTTEEITHSSSFFPSLTDVDNCVDKDIVSILAKTKNSRISRPRTARPGGYALIRGEKFSKVKVLIMKLSRSNYI